MNRIYRRAIKSKKNQKAIGRSTPQSDNLHKVETINGFNIIQLNEEEINLDFFSDLQNLPEKEITRIKKKAQSIEEYYIGKGKDSKINENCFNCLMNNFHENELLYFAKRKDLLTYLKYCFYFMKKILFTDNQIYTENKYDLDKCDIHYLSGWKFFIPKTMCRGCFLQMINMEHLFGNLKTIFSDVDATTLRRNFHRNRSHFNSRLRTENSAQKKENETINGNSQRKILGRSHKRMYFKYNLKNNKNISFDDKNELILSKKKILSEEDIENLKEIDKNKFLGKKKRPEENKLGELLVTEIKIKSNEFPSEKGKLNNEKNNLNKNNKDIKTDASEKTHENSNIIMNNPKNIQNNKISINMKNISIIENNNNNNFINKNPKEIINKLNINNEKSHINIFNEIMNKKGINNKIVMKLFIKLDTLIQLIYYALADVFDFREKLNNTLDFSPLNILHLDSSILDIYENNYRDIYNLLFKERKEFEEIFKKIKNDSVPSISRNLEKLRAQKDLKEGEIKALDELKQTLNGYTNQINNLEKNYGSKIKDYFNDFNCLLTLIGEIKESLN